MRPAKSRLDSKFNRAKLSVLALIMIAAVLVFAVSAARGEKSGDEGQGVVAADDPASQPVQELPDRRTASSNTFLLADGSLETRLFQAPVNYRDAKGDWQPIEEQLEELPSGAVTNGSNSFDIHLPEDLNQAPVRIDLEDGGWISQQALGVPTQPVDLTEETATYDQEGASAGFEFTSMAGGLKENIVLADPSAPSTYRYALETSAGITPQLMQDGSIELRDSAEELVAVIPAPVMSDSSTPPVVSDNVQFGLEDEGAGRWRLSVEADPEWISDPARVLPVRIDPTTEVGQPSRDCLIGSSAPETSYCAPGQTYLVAKAKYPSSGPDEIARTLLRFDYTSIPKTASITSATVGLYSAKTATNVTKVDLYDISKSWNESATWINSGGDSNKWETPGGDYGKLMSTPASVTTAQRGSQAGLWNFSSADLAWLVQRGKYEGGAKNGFLMKLADETPHVCCFERRVEWESSAGTNKPKLAVTYISPASADSQVSSPTDGTKTAKRFVLTSAWDHSNVEGVKFQYRINPYPPPKNEDEAKAQIPTMPWTDIPTSQVIDKNNQNITWPIGTVTDDRGTEPLYWNPTALAGTNAKTKFQIRAVLSGAPGASGYTKPVEAELDRTLGGPMDAAAPIGPGSVDLLTGNFSLSRTDVSIPAFNSRLSFSRSINSAESNLNPTGVLGPGWQPSSSIEVTDATGWQKLILETKEEEFEGEPITRKWASLKSSSGSEFRFDEVEEEGKTKFVTPAELAGTVLYRNPSTGNIEFTDPSGTRTVFYNNGSGSEYLPRTITQTGGEGNKTQMIYQVLTENKRRLKEVIAPSAPGISCTEAGAGGTNGCRLLEFRYKPATEFGAPAGSGDRLYEIRFKAVGIKDWGAVAKYTYDTTGRLNAAWDPRISPELKETYGYGTNNLLTSLTPAGLEPWSFQYGNVAGETSGTRLLSVKRASLVPAKPTAQTTIAYGVALSGSGRPDLTPQAVATWGQKDLPTDATAIFPPDEVPASPPSSYAHASIFYMDAEGQMTNVATPPGAGITDWSVSTAETDSFGNVVRELTPGNRARALSLGEGSAAKSEELDSWFTYSADGTKLLDERGPVHSVRLESGSIVLARSYRSIQYDVGAPDPKAGETWPLLPTNETTGALYEGKVKDAQSIQYGYNWTLRQQTEQIVDPEGLKIKTMTAYDKDTGLVTETRQPKDKEAAGSGTTKFIYYKKDTGSHGPCDKDAYAGLLCKEEPAVQPTGRDLPVTYFAKYNSLGQSEEVIETVTTPSAATRKSVMTYDGAGRPKTRETIGGDATQVPKVERAYNSTTGLPVMLQFVCPVGEPSCDKQTTTTTYDALGRAFEYQDADGITSKAGFDVNGRMISVDDGKGSQTIGYDGASGLPVELTDSMAGTFTSSYDPDGRMVQQSLPNGLSAALTVDPSGASTALTYTKSSNCGSSCNWLNFEVTRSAAGRILSEAGTLGSRNFSYDAAGRLEKAQETPAGGGCTTRVYAFDPNSNRTSKTTRTPGVGGVCTESGGTTQAYGYDSADRLNSSGVVYDLFGRVTTLPASLAGGSNLQTSYFSSGMVASQTQGGVTNTFGLDALMRQRQRVQAGGLQGVEVFHYSSDSDSPAWTQLGETWTRNIMGIGGGLTAIAKSGSGTRLQLANLHGDIVATASTDPAVSSLELNARTDEFGIPLNGTPQRFGWLGESARRTELASGVIQMGARSYVPAVGRFLSRDPITGGSANAYDYANQDPINSVDPTGEKPYARGQVGPCTGNLHVWSPANSGGRGGYGTFYVRFKVHCGNNPLFHIYAMKVRRQFLLGPGHNDRVMAETTNYPRFPGGSHWQGEWGNWNESDPPTVFGCLNGIEYQYTYEVALEWTSGNVSAERQNGVLTMQAQEVCGHGRY